MFGCFCIIIILFSFSLFLPYVSYIIIIPKIYVICKYIYICNNVIFLLVDVCTYACLVVVAILGHESCVDGCTELHIHNCMYTHECVCIHIYTRIHIGKYMHVCICIHCIRGVLTIKSSVHSVIFITVISNVNTLYYFHSTRVYNLCSDV